LSPVFNVNVGFEQIFLTDYAFRAGVYTDFSAAPHPKSVDAGCPRGHLCAPLPEDPPPHMDYVGGIVSFAMDTVLSTTFVGVNLAYGWGQYSYAGNIYNAKEYVGGLVIGGSFRYDEWLEQVVREKRFDRRTEELERKQMPALPKGPRRGPRKPAGQSNMPEEDDGDDEDEGEDVQDLPRIVPGGRILAPHGEIKPLPLAPVEEENGE
jgi:hypothetical protein